MSSSWTNRTCNICEKLFCCAECCKRHQRNKHPDQEFYCPLCYGKKLPLHPKLDEKLLYHVAVNHLPLYCYLCGDFFEQNKDIELFDPCKFWLAQRRPQLSISERRSLVATPISSNLGTKKKEHSTIDGDYNGNFVGPLTSPPELYRTTSTPMHVAVTGKQSSLEYKTPHVPNFLLKTPNISSTTSIVKSYTYGSESKSSDFEGKSSSYLTCYTNQDKTPFRSLPSDFGVEEQLSTKNNPGLMLSVMQEQERTEYITATKTKLSNYEIEGSADDMELTGIHGGILPEMKNVEVRIHEERRSSSFKKVRFSDQYDKDIESGRGSIGSSNMTENDEYYEARESLSRSTVTMEDVPMKMDNEKLTNIDANAFDKNRNESKVDSRSNTEKISDNENNIEKENRFYRTQTTHSNIGVTQKTGCSRVVMMVIVENNSTSGTSNIGPLIESGLKQLSSMSDLAECKITDTAKRELIKSSMENNVNTADYKFYSDSNSVSSQSNNVESSLNRNNSAGLLSSMTHAVKQALRSFPGGNFLKSTSSERMFKRDEIPSSSAVNNYLSNIASYVSNNSRKRSRDFKDESPTSTTATDSAVLYADDRSPMAKRHRYGWYKIRGREPIARMKNKLTSPRGISSETQIFSQGSLSVGNTIIPIPSRAHQSVQSDVITND
ncbi:uncharacterized protein LOC124425563 [Vespa crabro]|uniref:uncharacterized protein LOC124425563 n=1 Tax=Vespa crabro TaxID=7445 RepID=UPI001F0231D4|nr:uncharacterized protein LOC124425563 [Vespa crabro]